MWPFEKKPPLKHQPAESRGEGPRHDRYEAFGVFKPLFEGSVGYLSLLNLGPNSLQAVALVWKCCASTSNPNPDVCRLLRQTDWRPHLVGAVAIAVLTYDAEAMGGLWTAVDKGSWVTPQLAATAFLRDPTFSEHARERLRSGCPIDTSPYSGLSVAARHSLTGPGGTIERSAKAAASLFRLLELLPQRPDWLTKEVTTGDLANLLKKDIDSSGQIAEGWLAGLKGHLTGLGLATADGFSQA